MKEKTKYYKKKNTKETVMVCCNCKGVSKLQQVRNATTKLRKKREETLKSAQA